MLRSSQLHKSVSDWLIADLEEHSQLADLKIEWLNEWMERNLSQGAQGEILQAILEQWTIQTEKDTFRFFKRHIEHKPLQAAPCFKLLAHDYKHIMPSIEGFLIPPITETDFNREMKTSGYPSLYPSFIMQLAREGKLSYVEHALGKLEPTEVQELLPKVILEAAKNDYLGTVMQLKKMLEDENQIARPLFEIAVQNNYISMFRWLLKVYDDDELKLEKFPGVNIVMQIRVLNQNHVLAIIDENNHPMLKVYRAMRRRIAVDGPANVEAEMREGISLRNA